MSDNGSNVVPDKNKCVIAVDAMGGDKAPAAPVAGAVAALKDFGAIHIVIIGKKEDIERELSRHTYDKARISIINASDIISNEDAPATAIKSKPDSSLVVGLRLVKAGEAQAFVSAGNTGALLAGATLIVGRIKGIERPALATIIPSANKPFMLLDSGANVDCKPSYLFQFAKMGSIYMEAVRGVPSPRVGLLNIGEEREKGNALTKEAHELLEAEAAKGLGINFVGNVEARSLPEGAVDVVVCDGFAGNVVLKLTEGLSSALLGMVKKELLSTTLSKMGALLSKGAFARLRMRFNSDDIGGAPFLGLRALVVKAHGSSNDRAIAAAIRQCVSFIENDIVAKIEHRVTEHSKL